MSEASSLPLVCLDANNFLAELIPEATRTPKDETALSDKGAQGGRGRTFAGCLHCDPLRHTRNYT